LIFYTEWFNILIVRRDEKPNLKEQEQPNTEKASRGSRKTSARARKASKEKPLRSGAAV
jgi:hypothetical protein